MFQIQLDTAPGERVCLIAGRLDAANSREANRQLGAIQEANPGAPLLLDLSALDFLSSAGLGVILQAAKRARDARARLALCSPRPAVAQILDISGFDTLVSILPDRTSGLRAIAG